MKQLKCLISEFAIVQVILMMGKFSISPSEHCLVVSIGGLEFFMVLNSSKPGILVKIWNAVHLMTLARSQIIDDSSCILFRPVSMWYNNVEINSGVVHQSWLLSELLVVIEPINLSWLSICSVCLLLNLIGSLSVGLLMISGCKGNGWGPLSAQFSTVHGMSVLVNVSANLVSLLSVHQVQVFYLLVLLVVLVESVKHFLTLLLVLTICSIISALNIHIGVVGVHSLGLLENVLLSTDSICDVHGVLVSKGPMIVALVDLLKLIDTLLDVIERHVWSSFALLRHVHIFVILVILVHHSLEKVTTSSDTHTFDCFRTMCFWKSTSSYSSTWKMHVWFSHLIGWRIESHSSRCFLTILDVSHALRLITTPFHVAIGWSRLSGHFSDWPVCLVKANLGVIRPFCHVHLTDWIVLGPIVNSTNLIGMRSHCVLVHILFFVQLCLVDAGLGIKSVLINVTFLVKLLVDVCCFHQVTFNKALMNSSIKAGTSISLPSRSLWRSHEPPLVH